MKLYNSLTRAVEQFQPLKDNKVSLYTCGLTVYSQPHIGNWAAYIYWDVLVRTLRAGGYDVKRVQNITDVGHLSDDGDDGEDKLAKGARREQTTAMAVADKYADIANHEAYELLGLLRPDEMPRATNYIDQQIEWNQRLETAGYTYTIDGKGLYFDTAKLDDYGKLAVVDLEQLQSGKRIDDSGKRNPTDFVLWRLSPPGLDPEINWEWDSPWGKGIPGWHLECSVMASKLLGEQIDIHTGGIDHINVHHTNEIAQTEAITDHDFSQFWVHSNHIKVDGTKMSKSLGNLYTLDDLIERDYDLRAFKLMVLSSHYRTEGNFSWEIMDSAQARLQRWQSVADLRWQLQESAESEVEFGLLRELSDDLNTPAAIALIDGELDEIGAEGLTAFRTTLENLLSVIADLLGIDLRQPDISDAQKQLFDQRQATRDNQDWTEADKIRDKLVEQGIAVKDTDHGQRWQRILTS